MHPDPDLLALAALPAEPDDPNVQAHLHSCARCRSEVADLRRTVELARDGTGDPLPAPPPRVWQAIAAELGLPAERNGQVEHPPVDLDRHGDGVLDDGFLRAGIPGDGANGDAAAHDRPTGPADEVGGTAGKELERARARRRRRLRRAGALLVAAAIGLVVGLGIGRALSPQPPPSPQPVAQLAPVGDLDPRATGSVAMTGVGGERQMVVQVRGVTNISGGDHLEAWLMDASGTRLVPLGPLDGRDGDFHGTFAVPPGLPLTQFGRVDISAERWDGNPGHSTISVLRGGLS